MISVMMDAYMSVMGLIRRVTHASTHTRTGATELHVHVCEAACRVGLFV